MKAVLLPDRTRVKRLFLPDHNIVIVLDGESTTLKSVTDAPNELGPEMAEVFGVKMEIDGPLGDEIVCSHAALLRIRNELERIFQVQLSQSAI